MSRHIGIVAVSAEGAALCYRTICSEGGAFFGRHAHPEVTVHTYPLADYMRFIEDDDWDAVATMLLESSEILHRAGAEILICPDNTAHAAIDIVRERSALPWLDIAEEVIRVAVGRGFERLLVLGTRYLMEGPVYETRCASQGIDSMIPPCEDRERINAMIFEELVHGRYRESTRVYFRDVIGRSQRRGADAAVLGCTEIPMLIGAAESPLPVLDSTRILARAALREAR